MTVNQRVGRPPKQDDVDRKALVLEAAIRKISELGFETVKLTDIGKEAGVAPALIRHYFGSKDGMIQACNNEVGERLLRLFSHAGGKMGDTPNGHILQALVDVVRDTFQEERILLGYLCWLFLKGGKEAGTLYQAYHDAIANLVDMLKEREVIPPELSTYWFVEQYISIQMGPYFLAKPIAQQLGKDPFEADITVERSIAILHTLKAAAISAPEYKEPPKDPIS